MAKLDLDDLVDSAREVNQPSAEHAERLFGRVMAGVGAPFWGASTQEGGNVGGMPDPTTAGTASAKAAGTASGAKVMLGVSAVVVLGGAIALSSTASTRTKERATLHDSVASVEEQRESVRRKPEPLAPERLVEEAEPKKPSPATQSREKQHAPRDTLALEVSLVRQAKLALNQKQYPKALRLLNEYQTSFPKGTLRGEAQATRVLVLCALNKSGQARDAAQRLDGDSALGKRMMEGCKGR